MKNSYIKVPGRFNMLESKHVRLVALFDSESHVSDSRTKASFIDNLLLNPLEVSRNLLKKCDVNEAFEDMQNGQVINKKLTIKNPFK